MNKETKDSVCMSMSQHDRLLIKGVQSLARDKSISDYIFVSFQKY